MTVSVVHEPGDVQLTATGHLLHRCPHVDELDSGSVQVVWRCEGASFELHSLNAYFESWTDSTISHESITDRIALDLGAVDGITLLSVTTTWVTAGLEVRCSTSPTRAALQQ